MVPMLRPGLAARPPGHWRSYGSCCAAIAPSQKVSRALAPLPCAWRSLGACASVCAPVRSSRSTARRERKRAAPAGRESARGRPTGRWRLHRSRAERLDRTTLERRWMAASHAHSYRGHSHIW